MTVRELRVLLANANDDDLVVLSKDAEGNGYSPLRGTWDAIYVPDSTYSGNVYMRELTTEDRVEGYTEEDLYEGDDGQPALVLTPVN
jgi:hypothetical protein